MPWSPPMMLVSIVGHASFHTAGRSGPSIIERSYFRRSGFPAAVAAGATGVVVTGAVTSVNPCYRPSARNDCIDAPWPGAREHEIEEEETMEHCWHAPVGRGPERQWEAHLKIGNGHLTSEDERNRACQKA